MDPIIVTGASRSGKTLVRWLLSSHSRVTVARRTELWPRFAGRFGDLADDDNLARCLHAIVERRQVAWLGPDQDRLRREFRAGPPTYARLFALVHQQHAERTGRPRWGDQSGRFETCVGALLTAYPEAVVIHVVRDPRDRYEALLSRHAARPGDVGRTTAAWLRSVATARHVGRVHPDAYVVVRFEDLVGDPDTTARTLCAAIGESYEPEMVRMDATRRFDALRTVRDCPLDPGYVGRHRGRVDPHDIAFVQSVAGPEIVALGYPLDDVRLTASSRLRLAASRPVNLACMGAMRFPRLGAGSSASVSTWQTFVDSDAYRTITKRGPGRAILRSRPIGELAIVRKRMLTARRARPAGERFDDVTTFCAFVGHNKSGSSLCSALLDAHPDIVLSDEVDLLRYVARGFRRDQLFALAARGARAEARKGRVTARRLEPYSYAVSGGAQGHALRPRVVGDSTTGTSTRRFGADPYLWTRITVEVRPARPVLLQVIRNPFDPISVMMVRGRRSFADSIGHFFDACSALEDIRRRVGPTDLHEMRYEELVAAPRATLRGMCTFFGVGATTTYLEACAAVVAPRPAPRHTMVEWTPRWITTVEDHIADHDFLEGYSYDC